MLGQACAAVKVLGIFLDEPHAPRRDSDATHHDPLASSQIGPLPAPLQDCDHVVVRARPSLGSTPAPGVAHVRAGLVHERAQAGPHGGVAGLLSGRERRVLPLAAPELLLDRRRVRSVSPARPRTPEESVGGAWAGAPAAMQATAALPSHGGRPTRLTAARTSPRAASSGRRGVAGRIPVFQPAARGGEPAPPIRGVCVGEVGGLRAHGHVLAAPVAVRTRAASGGPPRWPRDRDQDAPRPGATAA